MFCIEIDVRKGYSSLEVLSLIQHESYHWNTGKGYMLSGKSVSKFEHGVANPPKSTTQEPTTFSSDFNAKNSKTATTLPEKTNPIYLSRAVEQPLKKSPTRNSTYQPPLHNAQTRNNYNTSYQTPL